MAHAHTVTDSDKRFTIKPIDRTIINLSGKTVLMQGDHNSERFTFEVPRYIDGHDMSECNKIEIHYVNGSSSGVYEVTDMKVDSGDETLIIFSWLISWRCTQNTGPLNFGIRFKCLTGDVVDYAWSTAIYSGITISSWINNADIQSDTYAD